jgi:23S rRNA (cytidine1920-2'-O)/16S rRNA (cytidine1409-2'-O)-methyltransferase
MSETKVVTEKFKNKRLDSILVEMSLVPSRQRAISLIMRGDVYVEEEKVSKPGKIIKLNQKIRLKKSGLDWVSRGGIKLDSAIKRFKINVEGKV